MRGGEPNGDVREVAGNQKLQELQNKKIGILPQALIF
jgi:hypothetical protein